jgi:sporulation protein YlmC with PRC-barrel domain
MNYNIRQNTNESQEGGKMLSIIGLVLIAGNIISAQPLADYGSKNEEIGRLPEIVVTATRYEGEDIAYSGMLPEIVITAPRGPEIGMLHEVVIAEKRYEGEDIAYSGMVPEIMSTAKRYDISRPILTFMRLVRHKMPVRINNLLIVTRLDSRTIGYLN